jgi:hypothetical protein
MSAQELRQAAEDGLNAEVGSKNPYAGPSAAATAWMLGYKSMLNARVTDATNKEK